MIAIMSVELLEFLRTLRGREIRVEKGAFLFQRGDAVTNLFAVESGSIHLIRYNATGGEVVLQRAEEGSILAEASVFTDRYHCGALAELESEVLAVPRTDFRRALGDDPRRAEMWAAHLAHQLQRARLQAEILSLNKVAERLDLWLASREEALPRKGRLSALAREIGVSREALYRELARRKRSSKGQTPNKGNGPDELLQ